MHEYSLVDNLLAQVDRLVADHHATGVTKIVMKIGELSGCDPSLFERAFETFRERTACAHAALSIQPVPAAWRCAGCGEALAGRLRCPKCGSSARLAAGDEIVLERVEMEVP